MTLVAKNILVPTAVNSRGNELSGPGWRSTKSSVPAEVPSLRHASTPCVPSSAEKKSLPPTDARFDGFESAPPGLMFLTRSVPTDVPLLFHNSIPPRVALAPEKYNVPPTVVKSKSELG